MKSQANWCIYYWGIPLVYGQKLTSIENRELINVMADYTYTLDTLDRYRY